MKSTTVIFALICIGLATAQWPCQDWGYNGPKPNCAGCTFLGSGFSSYGIQPGYVYGAAAQAFSVCTSCTVGFFLNQSACAMCTPGCDICNPNGACTASGCQDGFYFYPPNATCLSCPVALNCTQCALTTTDWFQYKTLFNGHWLNLQAPASTISRYYPEVVSGSYYGGGGQFTCTKCGTGYYITSVGGCSMCPAGSYSCYQQGLEELVVSCSQGYWQNVTATGDVESCVACMANCQSCGGPGSCNGGTTVAGGGYTALAPQSYSSALNYYTANGQGCVPGYSYDGSSTCTVCSIANCRACVYANAATGCVTAAGACATGFVSSSNTAITTATCVAVATTLTNCWIADVFDTTWSATASTTTCMICAPGFVLTYSTKTCTACPVNCTNATYDGSMSTLNGMQGLYYQNGGFGGYCTWMDTSNTTAVCFQCAKNTTLVQTDINGNTTLLPSGFGQGGFCAPLPGNCSEGQATSSAGTSVTCNVCYPGFGLYWISAGIAGCRPCLTQGCVSCDWTGVCQQCNVTQYLPPNQCLQCPYNCSVCANATYCYNNCTKNYAYNAALGQCLPTGAERIALGLLSIISIFLYFL